MLCGVVRCVVWCVDAIFQAHKLATYGLKGGPRTPKREVV